MAERGLSLVVESGGYSLVVLHGLHIVVASLVVELGLLGIWSSVVAAWEKAMAIHSSTLALKIPWIEEPGRLQSTGSRRVGHDFTFTFYFRVLEKEMATHSSVLAWRMPGTEEPSGVPSMGSHKVGHD